MWMACEDGKDSDVERLLRIGADANYQHKSVFGWSAMHLAAINDHPTTLCLLQEAGGRLNMRDDSGRTPLRLAKKHLRLLAVRALEQMMGYEQYGGSDTEIEFDENIMRDYGTTKEGVNESDIEGFMSFQKERVDQANISSARRRAKYNPHVEEPVDEAGLTASQKKHLGRLTDAARLNRETGVPMEHLLGLPTEHLNSDDVWAEHRRREAVTEHTEGPQPPALSSGDESGKGGYTSEENAIARQQGAVEEDED
eukprot:CAMPEP_0177727464 /NCGR_PEP_ID=MMETSP0484_2-20121128/20335_1 /TAXON_ID=354590 /ORGANISM="Rhodomonas lens, Strain RHODO" /LENGTH=253 /DNA_ID=CAMNT_0019240119 /DNA_START=33 /DNA_END=794 /DNA_ORIENTATION=+